MKKRLPTHRDKSSPSASAAEVKPKDAINRALALFNQRWVLRILWELRNQPMNFRELQVACGGLSSSVLNARLSELKDALLVQRQDGTGYALSDNGQALLEAMKPLLRWAPAWATAVAVSQRADRGLKVSAPDPNHDTDADPDRT